MKSTSIKLRVLVFACSFLLTTASYAVDIEPPKAQVVDKFGVNMANGQVTHSLSTVSIGGAMGLSHSVSVDANEFNFINYRGFRDKFRGRARNVELSASMNYTPNNILRVYDFIGSADFGYYISTTLQNSGNELTTGYNYVSMGDERQILEYDNTYLYWTKPDGTVSRFYRGVCSLPPNPSLPCASSPAELVDVTYPNGFVITITNGGVSVNTNTGFQLKGLYPSDNRSLDKPDRPNCVANGWVPPCLFNAPAASSANWAQTNPTYITGINNAYEYCPPTATSCTLTKSWPTATFNWPAGMPRTMFLGNSTSMNVVDSKGQKTTYTFKPYDVAYRDEYVVPGYTPDTDFSPRLVAIAPYGTSEAFTYGYKNLWVTEDAGYAQGVWMGSWDTRLQHSGVTTNATRLGRSTSYDMGAPLGWGSTDSVNIGSGIGGVSRVQITGSVMGAVGALYYVNTDDGKITFEATPRNFVSRVEPYNGPTADYTYTRSNLTLISYAGGDTTVQAKYPDSCTSTTRKTCNQAEWTQDAKGSRSYFWYHGPSGQVASVKYPANKNGVAAQVRNSYTQKSARYFNGGSSKITGSPIWMKSTERTCINSNTTYDPATGNGSCQGNDEVVTSYEYNNDNLLMTGMTVTV